MKTPFAIAIPTLLYLASVGFSQSQTGYSLDLYGTLRHPTIVEAIVITPDNQRAIVGLNDGALLAYSLESRKPIGDGLRFHSAIVGLAINPRGDRLASAIVDGYVSLIDPTTLKVITGVRMPATPERLVFSPDGASLFVAMNNGRLAKLNVSDLKIAKDILPAPGSRVLGLDCSRNGQIATGDKDGHIRLWTQSLDPAGQWKAHDKGVRSLAFHPSGQHLVSGGPTGEIKAWRVSDFSLVKETKDLHRLSIESIAFAPDGRFVTGAYDGLCQFWDGRTFEKGRSYPNYRGYFTAGAISADGRWLVRGGSSLDVVAMDDPEDFERIAEYGGSVMSLAVVPQRNRFASGGLDGRLILWEISKGVTSKTVQPGDWVTAVEFCDGGQSLAAGLVDGRIALYSVPALEPLKSWPAHDGRINALGWVADKLVSLGDDAAVRVWDLQGNRLRTHDDKAACRSLAVHGSRFAVGTGEGALTIYDINKDEPVKRIQGRPLSLSALAFTRDGSKLLAGYYDGGLEVFDTMTWTVAHFQAGAGERILSIDVHPSQDFIAVSFSDGQGRVYDRTLRSLGSAQPTPVRELFAARWALEDNVLALAGASNAITFWKMKSQERRALSLAGGAARIQGEVSKATPGINYQVALTAGRTYVIDMAATPGSKFDPYLRLLDPSGKEVDKDDDSGGEFDARITYQATVTGDYQIVATAFGGSVGPFTLSVRDASAGTPTQDIAAPGMKQQGELTSSAPTVSYPVTLVQGRSYTINMVAAPGSGLDSFLRLLDPTGREVENDDDSGGGTNARITHRASGSGTYRIVATSFSGAGTGQFTLTMTESGSAPRTTDSGFLNLAGGMVRLEGELTPQAKTFNYQIRLAEGRTYVIDMMASSGSSLDSYLRLLDASGRELDKNDDGGQGYNARITYRVSVGGVYQIVATSYGDSVGRFTLMVREQ